MWGTYKTSQILKGVGTETRGVQFIDDSQLATLSRFGELAVVNLDTQEVRILREKNEAETARPITWLPHSRQLVIGVESAIEFWDVSSGKLNKRLDCVGVFVTKLVADRDETRLFVGDNNGDITVWSTESGLPLLKLTGHDRGSAAENQILGVQSMRLSDDGRTLLSGARDGSVCVWESRTTTEQQRRERNTVAKATALVNSLAKADADAQLLSGEIRQLTDISDEVKQVALELILTRGTHLAAARTAVKLSTPVARLGLSTNWQRQLQDADKHFDRLQTELLDGLAESSGTKLMTELEQVNELGGDDILAWSILANEVARLPIRKSQADRMVISLARRHNDQPLVFYLAGVVMAAHHDWSRAHHLLSEAYELVDTKSSLSLLISTKLAAIDLRLGNGEAFAKRCEVMFESVSEATPARLRLRVARVASASAASDDVAKRCSDFIAGIDSDELPDSEVSWLSITKALLSMRDSEFKEALAMSEAALDQIPESLFGNYARSAANRLRYLAAKEVEAEETATLALREYTFVLAVQPFLSVSTQDVHRDWEQWILHDQITRSRSEP